MQTLLRLDLQALAPSVQRQLTRLVQSQQFEAPHERSDMRVACRKISPGYCFAHPDNETDDAIRWLMEQIRLLDWH